MSNLIAWPSKKNHKRMAVCNLIKDWVMELKRLTKGISKLWATTKLNALLSQFTQQAQTLMRIRWDPIIRFPILERWGYFMPIKIPKSNSQVYIVESFNLITTMEKLATRYIKTLGSYQTNSMHFFTQQTQTLMEIKWDTIIRFPLLEWWTLPGYFMLIKTPEFNSEVYIAQLS